MVVERLERHQFSRVATRPDLVGSDSASEAIFAPPDVVRDYDFA